jgi:hypothetical protein
MTRRKLKSNDAAMSVRNSRSSADRGEGAGQPSLRQRTTLRACRLRFQHPGDFMSQRFEREGLGDEVDKRSGSAVTRTSKASWRPSERRRNEGTLVSMRLRQSDTQSIVTFDRLIGRP